MPPHPLPDAARRRLRRLAWRARRPLAAVCAGIAVLLAVQQLRPPGPPTVVVLVAARDLPAGTTLTERDVEERTVAVALVPPALVARGHDEATGSTGGGGATDRASAEAGTTSAPDGDAPAAHLPGAVPLLGRRAAVDVPAGLPLVPGLLVATDADPPAGTVVVPVRFADPGVAAVLRPGVRVDVVAAPLTDGAEPERVAQGATVLARPAATPPEGSGDDTAALARSGDEDVPVLLAVTPDESVHLGGSAGSRVLGAVIVG
ncbi:SAF domain-containing protein [Cellulomonas triticagri]|uniref:Flagellar biosynthesis protein FlgA n=1 Tax=Cellulomonas triticagri TaxID=2483352 RepID=A0A3M2IXP7_9CELL|nr:SAF domain-containing protein [Cellulomonas triticagri]RMI03585.1 flagellar biosynthesis protein FlgA [Cellulomonas triticagri]